MRATRFHIAFIFSVLHCAVKGVDYPDPASLDVAVIAHIRSPPASAFGKAQLMALHADDDIVARTVLSGQNALR